MPVPNEQLQRWVKMLDQDRCIACHACTTASKRENEVLPGWGWPENVLPGYIRSYVHPSNLAAGQMMLLSTFRLPPQIYGRSANSKWLDDNRAARVTMHRPTQ